MPAMPPVPAANMTMQDWVATHCLASMIGNDDVRRAFQQQARTLNNGTTAEQLASEKAYELAQWLVSTRP